MRIRPAPAPLLVALLVGCNVDIYGVTPASGRIMGRVVDMDGDPLGGATVSVLEGDRWTDLVHTDALGWFETSRLQGNQWIRVEADGYLPRVRPAGPTDQPLFRLSESDGSTVRLVFVGSTTFGEGYYDQDGLGLRHGHELADIVASLDGVAPLLEGVQQANIVLEGPVSDHDGWHPDKPAVYRNHPLTPAALARVGFDFVHLANDHAFDLLDQGVADTIAQLEAAGLSHAGAGLDAEQAWAPTLRDVGALRLATIGCTTLTGADYAVGIVATDVQGGAAACDRDAIDERLALLAPQAELTVLQLHSGFSLDPKPSLTTVELAEQASSGGAGLVINHHPRVNGGLSWVGDALFVESLGAFATDLTLWETYPSALLEVHVDHDGVIQRAFLEPLLRDTLRPMAVLGWPRQRIARDLLAASSADVALDDGALELDLDGRSELQERLLQLSADGDGWSQPADLRDGWLSSIEGTDYWQVGRDLLRVGDFEDIDADDDLAEGFLWIADSSYEWFSDQAAYEGSYGLRMARDESHTEPVWTHPRHRVPLPPDKPISVAGQLRGRGDVELQVSWYDDSSGESFERSYHSLEGERDWTPFHVELTPPEGAEYANLYLKLYPPERGTVHVDIDALRLIAWENFTPDELEPYDSLRVVGEATCRVRRKVMPVSD